MYLKFLINLVQQINIHVEIKYLGSLCLILKNFSAIAF